MHQKVVLLKMVIIAEIVSVTYKIIEDYREKLVKFYFTNCRENEIKVKKKRYYYYHITLCAAYKGRNIFENIWCTN